MNRISQLDPQTATGPAKTLFDGVQGKLGVVPNLIRVLGNAPAALKGYLNFSAALGDGGFAPKVREQIALAVAEANHCAYCLSAHSFIGGKLGLTRQDLTDARQATAADQRTETILKLAQSIVVRRGELEPTELDQARRAGLTDSDIVETVAHVALNIFSNYINHIAGTVIDFPEVAPVHPGVASCDCA
ncbi:carboxymuconolactone decarboxylase family protein [Nitrospira moscoviensis]|uniref:Putative peroxidase-related enzyme n=1 Tax=Nitrospira moscoviensis TaxID=42253 RepID=A0A0K2GHU7_NITMO|nr:carboxymuconolactone decarboxylase family protein [Nitrospira moscoviensis]ALA60525.1 putative peroxidase-related enzyme [Nitrospira moscoviensis]